MHFTFKENKIFGFPFAIYNFHLRGIKDESEEDVKLLLDNLKTENDESDLFQNLFTLYRVASDKVNPEKLEFVLQKEFKSETRLYALGILRKSSSFPYSFDLAQKLINDSDWSIRCEAARTLCYYDYQSPSEIFSYLNLLFDQNPNVSLTAAQSIQNIKFSDESLLRSVNEFLTNLLIDPNLSENTRGEIFLFLETFHKETEIEFYEKYSKMVSPIFNYRYLANVSNYNFAFTELKKLYNEADDYNKFFIYSNLVNHFDSLKHNDKFINFVLDQYSSDQPLIITLNNFSIDSSFAISNSEKLREKISGLVSTKLEDSSFNQAISSSFNVTNNFDTLFTNEILSTISSSNNHELKYDLRNELTLSAQDKEDRSKLFDKLFSYAFEYSEALIVTNKGNFTIKFLPEVAPISVGNFIYLSKNNFYDNVIFHRVVPNFVIQTGDPTGTGWSGLSHTIVSEFSHIPFDTYYIGMASSGKDTEGSQWFVMQNNYPHLNTNYTNFGKVINGFEVIKNIDQYDVVKKIELIK
ncbi:MAG: peptidylprolyl isomerase [Melioribacteraceae bacterium]|nr:peptidylprolyl isomerase [Melioribacteraceae bacterium]